jgi:S-adenosylmethionine decarboxylase
MNLGNDAEGKEENAGSPGILGWHWFLDFRQCQSIPTQAIELESIMLEAARLARATVVQQCFHEFSPHGLTGVLVIAESHFAVHTWPEHQAVCVDIFSCTKLLDIEAAKRYLQKAFTCPRVHVRVEERSG